MNDRRWLLLFRILFRVGVGDRIQPISLLSFFRSASMASKDNLALSSFFLSSSLLPTCWSSQYSSAFLIWPNDPLRHLLFFFFGVVVGFIDDGGKESDVAAAVAVAVVVCGVGVGEGAAVVVSGAVEALLWRERRRRRIRLSSSRASSGEEMSLQSTSFRNSFCKAVSRWEAIEPAAPIVGGGDLVLMGCRERFEVRIVGTQYRKLKSKF